jgi:hypothetical protein
MNLRFVILAVLVSLLGLSRPLQATDYFVSPSGSDANSGTSPADPWQTISKVNSTTFSPGDNIYFEGGQSFIGSLSFGDGGTPADPITISSYGTGRATISSGNSYGFKANKCGGLAVTDLYFVGSGRTVNNSHGIEFFTRNTEYEYVRIDNVDVSGYKNSGIRINSPGSAGFRDVRITNCAVHDCGDKGIDCMGPWPTKSGWAHHDVYIGDCIVYDNPGIAGKGSHSGNGILVYSVDGGIVEFCEAYNNGELCDTVG